MLRPSVRVRRPAVALMVETSTAYGRGILHGVSQYLSENGPWSIYFDQRALQDPPPLWLSDWHGDGLILGEVSPAVEQAMRDKDVPIVGLTVPSPGQDYPHIQCDDAATGALAAEHLLERGFTRFAYLGYPGFAWSRRIGHGFAAAVQAAGYTFQEYGQSQQVSWDLQLSSWEKEVVGISQWIAELPRPLGLMACNDFRGLQALDACRRAGVSVPEDVAVIGVDNEVLACEFADPPLSTVVPDCQRMGYEAAALLDRIMKGEQIQSPLPPLPPRGIVMRQSTDVTAIDDREVAEAMRFIRLHACEGIQVDDVLEHVSVSRSALQRRFRAALGRTIHDAILATRLQRVKQMLCDTKLPLSAIADRTGFPHVEYLCTAFRRATGSPPGAYRRQHRRSTHVDWNPRP